ncbi:MAG: hypothetical protein IJF49_06800 [Clostridia bacterium]|nr:hypothetical protein [Clostridia bacterium]
MKIKELLLGISCFVMMAASMTGGTLAYFRDADGSVNVMTIGSVSIEQEEFERDANGNLKSGVTHAKFAIPVVGPIAWDETELEVNGTGCRVFTDELKNVLDHIVTVENTGKSDAYVRSIIAIEAPGYDEEDWIHVNLNENGVTYTEWIPLQIDGKEYICCTATYTEKLAPGIKAQPSMVQLFLDHAADNDYCAKFGGSWEILIKSQAMQAGGFSDAVTALNTVFGEVSQNNNPWEDLVIITGNEPERLIEALHSGKEIVFVTDIVEIPDAFDGKGGKITMKGVGQGSYAYLGFVPPMGEDTTVEDLTVSGYGFVEVGHYKKGGGDYTVNRLVLDKVIGTLTINDHAGKITSGFTQYGNAVLNDCIMTGTTAFAEHSDITTDIGCVNKTNTVVNRGKYGSMYLQAQAHVKLYDTEIGEIYSAAITTSNLGMLTIGAGTHVGTLYLIPPGKYPYALTIEEGATVDAIIYKGVTYTQDEWLAR